MITAKTLCRDSIYTGAVAMRIQEAIEGITDTPPAHTFDYVAEVVRGERMYQLFRWNPQTTPSNGTHGTASFLTYMKDYLDEAIHQVSRCPGDGEALETVRKITALGFACMEQNGAPMREITDEIIEEANAWLPKR